MTARVATLFTTLGAAAVLLSTIAAKPVPRYLWNASRSAPIGLYELQPTADLPSPGLGGQPPEPLATFLADRRYLPRGVLAEARLALSGDSLPRSTHVTVDKIEMGAVRVATAGPTAARLLGPVRHRRWQVFLMNWQSVDRSTGYFGALRRAIIGTAVLFDWRGE